MGRYSSRLTMARTFGHSSGVSAGTLFSDRRALSEAGVHRPLQAGISGNGSEGADSIVLSGGYEDDLELGDVIVYTGHGGQDHLTRRQGHLESTVGLVVSLASPAKRRNHCSLLSQHTFIKFHK